MGGRQRVRLGCGPACHRSAAARAGLAITLPLLLALAPPARAQFTARDGQIIARALSFVEPRRHGTLQIGIVYDPARPVSLRQAHSLLAAIGQQLPAGTVTLTARLLPIEQLPHATDLAGIFVTAGLDDEFDRIGPAVRRLRIPTISTELDCVRSAHCVLGFSSQPNVEIILNHTAASRAGVHFAPAFRMLVREL